MREPSFPSNTLKRSSPSMVRELVPEHMITKSLSLQGQTVLTYIACPTGHNRFMRWVELMDLGVALG